MKNPDFEKNGDNIKDKGTKEMDTVVPVLVWPAGASKAPAAEKQGVVAFPGLGAAGTEDAEAAVIQWIAGPVRISVVSSGFGMKARANGGVRCMAA